MGAMLSLRILLLGLLAQIVLCFQAFAGPMMPSFNDFLDPVTHEPKPSSECKLPLVSNPTASNRWYAAAKEKKTALTTPVIQESEPSLLPELQKAIGLVNKKYLKSNKPYFAVIELLQNLELVPRGGKIHVRGPGENYMEWLLPLLARPDAQVSASDPEFEHRMGYFESEHSTRPTIKDEYVKKVWEDILEEHPSMIDEFRSLRTFQSFEAMVRTRLVLYYGQPYNKQADLLIAKMPLDDASMFGGYSSIGDSGKSLADDLYNGTKNKGFVWLYSERVYPDYISEVYLRLPSLLAPFVPQQNDRGGYRAFDDNHGYLVQVGEQ